MLTFSENLYYSQSLHNLSLTTIIQKLILLNDNRQEGINTDSNAKQSVAMRSGVGLCPERSKEMGADHAHQHDHHHTYLNDVAA